LAEEKNLPPDCHFFIFAVKNPTTPLSKEEDVNPRCRLAALLESERYAQSGIHPNNAFVKKTRGAAAEETGGARVIFKKEQITSGDVIYFIWNLSEWESGEELEKERRLQKVKRVSNKTKISHILMQHYFSRKICMLN